jgi:hypothetical protein
MAASENHLRVAKTRRTIAGKFASNKATQTTEPTQSPTLMSQNYLPAITEIYKTNHHARPITPQGTKVFKAMNDLCVSLCNNTRLDYRTHLAIAEAAIMGVPYACIALYKAVHRRHMHVDRKVAHRLMETYEMFVTLGPLQQREHRVARVCLLALLHASDRTATYDKPSTVEDLHWMTSKIHEWRYGAHVQRVSALVPSIFHKKSTPSHI